MRDLQTSVQYLTGVGPNAAKRFAKLGILTVEDLIYYFPYEYEDRQHTNPISSIKEPLERVLIKGEIIHIENQKLRGRFSILKVSLKDKTASIRVIFFNQPFLQNTLCRGMKLIVTGKAEVNSYEGGLQIIPRDWEIDTGDLLPIVPIYHLTEALYPKYFRKIIKTALDLYLDKLEDALPEELLKKYSLPEIKTAVAALHLPKSFNAISPAKQRIIFEDFFTFQLGLGLRKKEASSAVGVPFAAGREIINEFPLPFKLTAAQERAWGEILDDLKKSCPMNRLLMGDVGSGKTVVAAISAFIAQKNGYQTAIMAPTEILALQHYQKMTEWFKPDQVELVTGTTQKKGKKKLLDADIIIGTHALIEEKIKFKKLGLAVIDEQHRFGVLQRSCLAQKGYHPHLLFMTATPIPRSLALTLYGDLDRSIIDEMPPGRVPVKTHYVPDKKRKAAYEFIRNKLKEGEQAFIVCPLVEESEALDLKAAKDEAALLQDEVFPEYKVGLVHGRLKSDLKEQIMRAFREKKIQVLVATTVIEVGIDIPNASVMVIEHAPRFGLSQLHQLRGRIGRGKVASFCFLMGEPKTAEAKTRIRAMLEHSDGFKIAEVDLALRGPGDFCGVRQAGLPKFRLADIVKDEAILRLARTEAFAYLNFLGY